MTKKSNRGLADYALKALSEKWVYWYGTTGVRCTEALLQRKAAQYPEHYAPDRMALCRRHIAEGRMCADCINLIKGYMWLDESTGRQIYAANGCPDTNANGMFFRATEKGDMASMPELPGLIVRFNGHAGVYVGNGQVVEARGFSQGVVLTAIDERPWTHWYKLPCLNYDSSAEAVEYVPGDRMLKRGSKGGDVKAVQNMLTALGYALPEYGADGVFGAETEQAVRAFQSDARIEVDGLCGPETLAALTARQDKGDGSLEGSRSETALVKAASADIFAGPGAQFDLITRAEQGTALTLVPAEGWTAVLVNGRAGFIRSDLLYSA